MSTPISTPSSNSDEPGRGEGAVDESPQGSEDRAPRTMKAAKAPVGVGSAPLVAQLLALALIALGVVGIEEALVRTGAISQPSWTTATVEAMDRSTADRPVVLILAIAGVLLGLVLLSVAFKRRPRKTVALSADTGVYLRTRDLKRVATSALEGADGVTDVDVVSGRRTMNVRATTLAPKERNSEIEADLRDRLSSSLSALASPPRVKVAVRNEELA